MDEFMNGEETATDLDRREMLRRGAVVLGATALWTTPVVQTLGMRPAAAGSANDPLGVVLCPDDRAAPSNLVFRYIAGVGSEASVEIRGLGGPAPGTWCVANLLGGQSFQVPGTADPEMAFTVAASGATEPLSLDTSCSQPLAIGDRVGSLMLIGGYNSDGVRVGVTDVNVVAVLGECTGTQSSEAEEVEDPEDIDESEDELKSLSDDDEVEREVEVEQASDELEDDVDQLEEQDPESQADKKESGEKSEAKSRSKVQESEGAPEVDEPSASEDSTPEQESERRDQPETHETESSSDDDDVIDES